jgi:uncharacterized protein (DUF2147 family)
MAMAVLRSSGTWLPLLMGLLLGQPAAAQAPPPVEQLDYIVLDASTPTPTGIWQDDSSRVWVQIQACGERLCGTLVWFKWPDGDDGRPLVDLQNADPALRDRPLLGLTILRDLRRTAENRWEGGAIYNPENGIDYRARMSIEDDTTLRVRAYALLPLFGKTQIWTRIR